jgi:hypothetical protein
MLWFDGMMPQPLLDPTNVEDLIWSFASIHVEPEQSLSTSHDWGSLALSG